MAAVRNRFRCLVFCQAEDGIRDYKVTGVQTCALPILDLADFLIALKQMQAMGPIKQVLGLLPGVNAQALKAVNADDKRLKHVEAIVLSMTPDERADPSILTGSRRLRIAKGAGRSGPEVNRLLGQFQQMRKLLKRT